MGSHWSGGSFVAAGGVPIGLGPAGRADARCDPAAFGHHQSVFWKDAEAPDWNLRQTAM
jgi:hypothetical protein